jgi:hypothetical protein
MRCANDLTAEYVRECLDYDAETGLFTWKNRPREHFKSHNSFGSWNSKCAGKYAGFIQHGYLIIKLNSISYRAHRLAWLFFYGKWPKHQIDHDDGNRSNNRISNLNDVPNSKNSKNRKLNVNNKSGHAGVFLQKNIWISCIRVNSKPIHLGSFKNLDEAIKVRKAAEIQYGFHKNHGDNKRNHYGR